VSNWEHRQHPPGDGFGGGLGRKVKVRAVTSSPRLADVAARAIIERASSVRDAHRRSTTMLIDEILRALRDPEYRAQLTAEARGAMPDLPLQVAEHADSEQESASES
jgi:mersacidin/lichenicidin family type 2 lantibiotic